MARGPIKPKPDVALSSGIETGLTYEMIKMFKDDSEVQRKKVKEMEYEIQAYRDALRDFATNYDHDEDAHKYNNLAACRVCSANKTLNRFKKK